MSTVRMQRKAGRREAQLAKMAEKAEEEAKFFWECVRKSKRQTTTTRTALELFGPSGQTSAGINFAQYDAIPVTRTGTHPLASESITPPVLDFVSLFDEKKFFIPGFVTKNLVDECRMNYRVPTPVQKHTVPLGLKGLDVMACAQTGSGKTVAFLLPLIATIYADKLDVCGVPGAPAAAYSSSASSVEGADDAGAGAVGAKGKKGGGKKGKGGKKGSSSGAGGRGDVLAISAAKAVPHDGDTPAQPAALVLAPTRELAIQIEQECAKLCFGAGAPSHVPGASTRWCALAYGGANARGQLETLAGGVAILVATPGRLVDFLEKELVSLKKCKFLVLDEADRMLDMGFEPQLKRVIECSGLPGVGQRQTLMFSATFAPNIQSIAKKYLRQDFAKVEVGRVGSSIASIEQNLLKIDLPGNKKTKLEVLVPLLKPGERTIVFVQKKHVATFVKKALVRSNLSAEDIHGDRSQSQREAALAKFRAGQVDVLVATDVAARGLDVLDVAHVVQFDLPVSAEDFDNYVHRIGRTGRAGKLGRATAMFVPGHEPKVGNGGLIPDLRRIFEENGQALPVWFEQEEGGCSSTGTTTRSGAPKQAPAKNGSGGAKRQAAPEKAVPPKQTNVVFAPESRTAADHQSRSQNGSAKKGKGKKGGAKPVANATPAGPAGKSTGGAKGKGKKGEERIKGGNAAETASSDKDTGAGGKKGKRSGGKGKGKW